MGGPLILTARPDWGEARRYEFEISTADAYLSRYSWWLNRQGYIYRQTTRRDETGRRKSTNVYIHREIMDLPFGDPLQVDHLDGNPGNNRQSNLEIVTAEENIRRRDARRYRTDSFIPPSTLLQ